jgi:alkylresorcinol/alkylpyrone synthase
MSRHVILADFKSVEMQAAVRQEALLSYTAWLLATARCASARTQTVEDACRMLERAQAAVLRYGVSPSHIAARQFNALPESEEQLGATGAAPVLPDWLSDIAANPAGPTIDRRMRAIESLAHAVFEEWYAGRLGAPDQLIHVTCSGYSSPSPAQQLVSAKGWYSTAVTHSYHMGCYGAFPAIRAAIGSLAPSILALPTPKRRVDIVHTEYLSAHIATLQDTPGEIIDTTLFGDGFIGYSVYPERVFAESPRPGFRILAQHEQLIPSTLDEMSWRIGSHHFEMYLSKNVPLLIKESLLPFVQRLCSHAGLDFAREKRALGFAIHPGGPRILDHACQALGIEEEQLRHARQVFRELGNMSSATVPYILMRLLADPSIESGTRVVSVGFGPGLTATGLLLEKT